jgi:hypothetical protein
MKKWLDRLPAGREWIGGSLAVLTAAGLYLLLIHPSLASFAALDDARASRRLAEKTLDEARQTLRDLHERITRQKAELKELGGSPPSLSEKEAQIGRITIMAQESRLSVDQYSPVGIVDEKDYSAVFVQFTVQGPFTAARELFARIESELDYVDITHFTVTAVEKNNGPACLITWSCKISGMPRQPWEKGEILPLDEMPGGEVALHEP